MTSFCKKNKAFTISEVLIVFLIIGIVSVIGLKAYRSKLTFERTAMYYSALKNFKAVAAELYSEGCTTTDVTNTYCTVQRALPQRGHIAGADSSRSLCSRLSSTFNISGTIDCTQTASDATNFGTATPNFILSNGQRVFGLGTTANTSSYNIYIDINGLKGTPTLASDVFKFILYTDSTLLPNDVAATTTTFLRANVVAYNAAGAEILIANGLPYAQAYCLSLSNTDLANVNSNKNNYCAAKGYSNDAVNCGTSGCRVDIIKPGY